MGDAAADGVMGGAARPRTPPTSARSTARSIRRHRPEPAAAAPGLRRGGAGRARALHPRVRPHAADRRARGAGRPSAAVSARHGGAAVAGGPTGRPRHHPAIVRETADDSMLRDALLENIHRVQLNPLEEAAAYQQLLDEFGVTHDELAARIGRSRPLITNMIRLAAAADRGAAARGRRRAVGRARARAARPEGGPGDSRRSWPPASSRRGCRSARPRRQSLWRTARTTATTGAAPQADSDAGLTGGG